MIEPSDSVQPGYLGGDLTLGKCLPRSVLHVLDSFEEVGTTLYMAPEVRSEKDRPRESNAADPAKADMYSLGVVLWEIVTGQRPQRGRLRACRCRLDPASLSRRNRHGACGTLGSSPISCPLICAHSIDERALGTVT